MSRKPVDFLPEDFVERRIERRTNIICLILFAVVLIGVVGAYAVTRTQLHLALRERERIGAAYEDAARRIAQLDELQHKRQALLRKVRVTAMLIEPVPRSNLLAALAHRMPEAASLENVTLKSTQVQVAPTPAPRTKSALADAAKAASKDAAAADLEPEVQRYRVELSVVGLAPTDIQVAQYIADLAESPLLESVDLVYSEEARVNGRTTREFKIDIVLDPEADIRRIDGMRLTGVQS